MANSQKRFYQFQLLFNFFNILLLLYLSVQHTRLKLGIQESLSFCSFGKFADCDVVNASQYSEIFGIPLAVLGAIFYFFLFALGLMSRPQEKGFAVFQKSILWLGSFAFLLDIVVFLFIQVFVLKSICVLCMTSYLLSGLQLYFLVRSRMTKTEKLGKAFRKLAQEKGWPKKKDFTKMRLGYALTSLILFSGILIMMPNYFRQKGAVYSSVDDSIKKFYSEWRDKPRRRIEVRDHNGTFGNPQAKVQIVTFSDFECPFCRKAAFTLHTALHPLKDKVHLVFKHFPLNANCNPMLQYQMHTHACKLAQLAICANQKNKFWDFHDLVFLKTDEALFKQNWDELKPSFSKVFTETEIESCLKDKAVQADVAEDVTLGITMKLTGTPTTYINGKQVTIPLTVETVRELIAIEEKTH